MWLESTTAWSHWVTVIDLSVLVVTIVCIDTHEGTARHYVRSTSLPHYFEDCSFAAQLLWTALVVQDAAPHMHPHSTQ